MQFKKFTNKHNVKILNKFKNIFEFFRKKKKIIQEHSTKKIVSYISKNNKPEEHKVK